MKRLERDNRVSVTCALIVREEKIRVGKPENT